MIKKTVTYAFAAGVAATLTLTPVNAFAATSTAPSNAFATTSANQATVQQKIDQLLPKTSLSPVLKQRVRQLAKTLPADWLQTVHAKQKQYGLTGTTYFEQSQSAIGAGDSQCQSTALTGWMNEQLGDVNVFNLLLLNFIGGDQIPTYDALIFGQQSKANSFGIDGSYTNELTHEMTSLKRFWDFDGSKIQLIPMHGSVYQDVDRIADVYEALYGRTPESAAKTAAIVQDIVMGDPGLEQGENPYFTFNAFAFDPQDDPQANELGITKRIIVGDGILQGMRGIGLGDKAAPLGVLAHEYGHHVQYAKGLFDSDLTGPAATRRTELMADAFGSYFVVHARGEALNAQRTLDVERSFYNVGDCNLTSDDHHGTPGQRLKSSSWAVNVVDSAANQGHKLTAMQFDVDFETQLPTILGPGA